MAIRSRVVGLIVSFFSLPCSLLGQTCNPPTTAGTPLPNTPFTQTVPHITTGAGFITKLTIVNPSASANTIVLNDISQSGTLISSQTCNIPANGTLRLIEGNAANPSETHWAIVGSQAAIGINLFFEFTLGDSVVTTVGFNDAAPQKNFIFPVEFQSAPFHTIGLGIANPAGISSTVTVTLLDGTGKTLGSSSTTLVPYGQISKDLLQPSTSTNPNPLSLAQFLPSGNFIGSIVVTATSPITVVGVGDDQGPFFSEAPMVFASGSASTVQGPAYFLAGNWAGTAVSAGTTYNISAWITQTATKLTATVIYLAPGSVAVIYTASGQINGSTVAFSPVSYNNPFDEWTGSASATISADGLTVTGSGSDPQTPGSTSTGTITWNGQQHLSGNVSLTEDAGATPITWTGSADTDGQHLTGTTTGSDGTVVTWSLTRQ